LVNLVYTSLVTFIVRVYFRGLGLVGMGIAASFLVFKVFGCVTRGSVR
jgi:hypothetical protein